MDVFEEALIKGELPGDENKNQRDLLYQNTAVRLRNPEG
jgi:hypothetical protein